MSKNKRGGVDTLNIATQSEAQSVKEDLFTPKNIFNPLQSQSNKIEYSTHEQRALFPISIAIFSRFSIIFNSGQLPRTVLPLRQYENITIDYGIQQQLRQSCMLQLAPAMIVTSFVFHFLYLLQAVSPRPPLMRDLPNNAYSSNTRFRPSNEVCFLWPDTHGLLSEATPSCR